MFQRWYQAGGGNDLGRSDDFRHVDLLVVDRGVEPSDVENPVVGRERVAGYIRRGTVVTDALSKKFVALARALTSPTKLKAVDLAL